MRSIMSLKQSPCVLFLWSCLGLLTITGTLWSVLYSSDGMNRQALIQDEVYATRRLITPAILYRNLNTLCRENGGLTFDNPARWCTVDARIDSAIGEDSFLEPVFMLIGTY
jgi:hypothetical protein